MAQIDPFKASNGVPNFAPRQAEAVDLSSANYTPQQVTKRIYVGVAGHLIVIMADGDGITPVTFTSLAAGFYDLQIKTFVKTGTTATNLVALYG